VRDGGNGGNVVVGASVTGGSVAGGSVTGAAVVGAAVVGVAVVGATVLDAAVLGVVESAGADSAIVTSVEPAEEAGSAASSDPHADTTIVRTVTAAARRRIEET
jgi:hypothetical protein